jgi:DNA-binding NarL/FixJ family response regulator
VQSRNGDRIGLLIVRNATPLFTDVLSKALAPEPSVRLLSRPLTVDEALEFCLRKNPDVILVEVTESSDATVHGLVRSISRACHGSPIILLADELVDDAFLVAGIDAGASGIVDATAGIEEVLRVVRAAADGKTLVDPDRFLEAVEATAQSRWEARDWIERGRRLTDREREVLRCLTDGLRNAEIAARLSISSRTVDKHVQHILRKLDARSRLHAATLAARMEALTVEPTRGRRSHPPATAVRRLKRSLLGV